MLEKIQIELKKALKEKNIVKVRVFRNIIGEFKLLQISKKKDLDNTDYIRSLQSMAKKNKESISQFNIGNRDDLVQIELEELKIIESFLPKKLTRDETIIIINEIINEENANNMSDIGRVMPQIMKKISGRYDGKIISELVKKLLS